MPRGYGHIQRKILDTLLNYHADNWTITEIAKWVYYPRRDFKPYELSNIVRALRALERRGVVQVSPYLNKGAPCWSAIRKQRPKQKVVRQPRLVVVSERR